jgi:3-hydroxyisobutyrate dehydrogenase-like beta-hydroxyacid dehydrogenase
LIDERVEQRVAAGATAAGSGRGVAAASSVVFLSLPTTNAIEKVVSGPNGVLDGMDDHDVLVDLSTSSPVLTTQLSEAVADVGGHMLGAPVSEGARVDEGRLTVMVGGDEDVLERVRELFDSFAMDVFHVGSRPKDGHVAKLLNNYLLYVGIIAVSEAVVLGEAAGLDPDSVVNVINNGSGRSFVTREIFPEHVLSGSFDMPGRFEFTEKEMRLFCELLANNRTQGMLGLPVNQVVQQASLQIDSEENIALLYEYIEEMMD